MVWVPLVGCSFFSGSAFWFHDGVLGVHEGGNFQRKVPSRRSKLCHLARIAFHRWAFHRWDLNEMIFILNFLLSDIVVNFSPLFPCPSDLFERRTPSLGLEYRVIIFIWTCVKEFLDTRIGFGWLVRGRVNHFLALVLVLRRAGLYSFRWAFEDILLDQLQACFLAYWLLMFLSGRLILLAPCFINESRHWVEVLHSPARLPFSPSWLLGILI
jgi:hypothetical protein